MALENATSMGQVQLCTGLPYNAIAPQLEATWRCGHVMLLCHKVCAFLIVISCHFHPADAARCHQMEAHPCLAVSDST